MTHDEFSSNIDKAIKGLLDLGFKTIAAKTEKELLDILMEPEGWSEQYVESVKKEIIKRKTN